MLAVFQKKHEVKYAWFSTNTYIQILITDKNKFHTKVLCILAIN